MLSETVLASEYLYQGRIVKLRIDQVRTLTGLEVIREIVEHPGAVAIVALDDRQRVVLVKQYRHAVRAMTIEIPAGTMEPNEDPLEAAQRELREETGFTADRFAPIGSIHPAPGWSTEHIHLYLATGLTPGPTATEPDESIELLRVPLPDAVDMIRSGSIDDGKSISALLLAQSRV